jgi:hypothetical protein
MKKTTFYSMVRENTGATIALQQKGYTDGTYYYYKKDSLWLVIHPANGLSICSGHTRKEAAAQAHEPRLVERIAAALERQPEAAERFAAAVKKAKEAA